MPKSRGEYDLPILPPVSTEPLCMSCSFSRGGPVLLSAACVERRHAKMTRQQWERRNSEDPSSRNSNEVAQGSVSHHTRYQRQS